jgi:hypothetical protein
MIDIKHKKCIEIDCNKRPNYNLSNETRGLYCSKHKLDNMINVTSKRCIYINCSKQPIYNIPSESTGLYCLEHKLINMINIKNNKCQYNKCKDIALYGLVNKKPQFCINHKKENMINIILYNKCSIFECKEEYNIIFDNIKYCLTHCPNKSVETTIKRLCKYCDILEESTYICNECNKIRNKKEWAIVRHLRKVIKNPFDFNSSKMLQGCSMKRPDIYFELNKHCVIVEIDENQHDTYTDSCECARVNEIVNGIGGKSVIIIRYNTDKTTNNGKIINFKTSDKIELLVNKIKEEISKEYDNFIVKLIQLYYNDNNTDYKVVKEENITNLVCI